MFLRVFTAAVILPCILSAQSVSAQQAAPPPTVMTAKCSLAASASPKRYAGTIESIRHVDIMPRVTGNLLIVNFKEGQNVEKGRLLYELEDTTYRASVDALKAQKEQLEATLAFAESEYKRSTTLLKSEAVSVSTHEKAVLEINAARARLKELSAALVNAENTLSYTKIYAPLSGKIGKSVYSEGNLVTPGGGRLNDIEMTAPIYVRFSLSERVFRRDFGGENGIRERAAVRILLADGEMYNETAQVTLVDNKFDRTTNTITLWATFLNADGKLIPGGFATVLVSEKEKGEFPAVIPSALVTDGDGYYVYYCEARGLRIVG